MGLWLGPVTRLGLIVDIPHSGDYLHVQWCTMPNWEETMRKYGYRNLEHAQRRRRSHTPGLRKTSHGKRPVWPVCLSLRLGSFELGLRSVEFVLHVNPHG